MAGPTRQQKPDIFSGARKWVAEQGSELAHSAHELEAAGRKAWNEATRTGQNVQAATTAQLRTLGAQVLAGEQAAKRAVGRTVVATQKAISLAPQELAAHPRTSLAPGVPSRPAAIPPKSQALRTQAKDGVQNGDLLEKSLGRWDNVPGAKPWVGVAAQALGVAPGALRGGLHAVEGLAQTVDLGRRLSDPLELLRIPQGNSAWNEVLGAGRQAERYVADRISHPEALVGDLRRAAHKARVDLDPGASPEGKTLADEARRRFGIGMNEGELGFDVGSAFAGGPGAKFVGKAGRFFREADSVERYLKKGYSLEAAQHLASPYENGAGSHYVPQKLFKDGGPLSRVPFLKNFKDSEWNVSKPEGMTRGQFYDYHYENDPFYHGARMPASVPEMGWSGKRMGLKKRGPLGRLWFGMPAPLKARALGSAGTFGGTVQSISEDEDQE